MSYPETLSVLIHRLKQARKQAVSCTDPSARLAHESMTKAYAAEVQAHPENLMTIFVKTLSRYVRLSLEDIQAITELPFVSRTLPYGSYLLREGDLPTECALLLSGFVFRQKLTHSGARQILSLHLPGEALDLQNLFLDMSDHSVQTLSQVNVAVIPRQALAQLAQTRMTIARAITTSLLIEASISREWMLNIARRDSRARVAHLICEFGMRLATNSAAQDYAHELPMTQEQIGDALGLTPVHVNRTLRGLEKEGLLTRTGRKVGFPDWERLRDVAGFSPNYLHLEQYPS